MDQNLRTYETICITKVDMPDDKYNALLDRCKAAVANEGKGKIIYSDDWGRAKIAYTIGKDNRGRWTYLRYQSSPHGVDEVQRSMKINEFVLRQLTVQTKEDGSEYDSLREGMPRDLADRDRPRDWRGDREGRGPRREYGDRGDRGGYGDRDNRSSYGDRHAPTQQDAESGSDDGENV